MTSWARTPLITPKFDPRLYQTPLLMTRSVKPGEVILSMEGSPLTNEETVKQNKGVTIPLGESTSITLTNDVDISNLELNGVCVDSEAIENAIQALMQMKMKLNAVNNFKTGQK